MHFRRMRRWNWYWFFLTMSTGSAHLRRERKEALLRDALLVDAFRVLVVAVLLVHDRLRQIEQGVLRSDSARLHEGEGILRILKIQGTDVGDPDVKEAHVLEVERTVCELLETPLDDQRTRSRIGGIVLLHPLDISAE